MKALILQILVVFSTAVCAQQAAPPAATTSWQYVILNDKSGRTLWPGGTKQQADVAVQFLKSVVKQGSDVGSLVNFNDEYFLDVANSTNPDELAVKLARQGRSGTSVYDAIVAAANWLGKQDLEGRQRMIFLFSDFDDDASRMTLKKSMEVVQALHIPVVIIAPSAVQKKTQGKNAKRFADGTGGHVYFVQEGGNFDFTSMKSDLAR